MLQHRLAHFLMATFVNSKVTSLFQLFPSKLKVANILWVMTCGNTMFACGRAVLKPKGWLRDTVMSMVDFEVFVSL